MEHQPTVEDFISLEDLAAYLGVPARTLLRSRGLKSIALGGNRQYRLFSKATVAGWLKSKEGR